jgi:type I restriction-modification system DNA methylase subunit
MLAAVAEHAEVLDTEFYGQDINPLIVDVAKALALLAPASMSVERRDSFARPVRSANLIISAPPWGLRLNEPHELLSGDRTKDGDLAVIDVCLRALIPGGRAVMLLTLGWTFRSGAAQRYRAWLSGHSRVAALVGLPAGSLTHVRTPTLILVLENREPSKTFVGELEADWQEQLSVDGMTMRALQEHLNDPGEKDTAPS